MKLILLLVFFSLHTCFTLEIGQSKIGGPTGPINRCVGPHTLPGAACRAMIKRYTFDAKKGCVEFTFGGCRPAPNNFETLDECRKACIAR
ncbi:unnamed protein product [Nippostrongylus brasiliensis]|uniref:BPTI/Kunitz inhibitor domain-containing protein n=1 Tax=Nippostrongylus brasiliensis TaxID=27835 RepID=A0A0N4YUW9_NIPBR|nr:unnamed protein product [Nippostrongylus brasiliensis]